MQFHWRTNDIIDRCRVRYTSKHNLNELDLWVRIGSQYSWRWPFEIGLLSKGGAEGAMTPPPPKGGGSGGGQPIDKKNWQRPRATREVHWFLRCCWNNGNTVQHLLLVSKTAWLPPQTRHLLEVGVIAPSAPMGAPPLRVLYQYCRRRHRICYKICSICCTMNIGC